jgi:hypothetical protein
MPFQTIAIPTSIAASVRSTGVSPFASHPAHTEIATGHGPCRHCLKTFRIGEERRVLFTLDPFDPLEELPLPGPVFVHEADCDRYPAEGGFPEDLRLEALTLNAYSRGRKLRAQEYVTGERAESAIEELLVREDVDYIHVRDTQAGCYDFRIEPLEQHGD